MTLGTRSGYISSVPRLVVLIVVLLGGCQQMPAPTPQQLVSMILAITKQDLQSTIDIAASVSPPDLESIQCARFLQDFIPTLAGPVHTFVPPTGVASTFEVMRLGLMQSMGPSYQLSNAQHQALDIACAPLAVNTAALIGQGIMAFPTTPNAFLTMLLALARANL